MRHLCGCSNLVDINIPNSVTSIVQYAFWECTNLKSITIPNNITIIENNVFNGCSSLESVVIPDTVTSIDMAAFQNCSSLTDITLPRGLTAISRSSFSGCSSLATINIPDNVTIIEGFAFSECVSLNNIVIPENVTTIQGYAFQGCTSLTEIKIPEKTSLIAGYAFENCTNLESITMPQNDEFVKINKYTFSNCTNLKDIIIPSTVTSIEQGAFSDCTSLTEIIIPSSVTDIKYNVFDGCSNLNKAYIYNKETVFRSDVFIGCADDLTIFGYSGSTAQTYAADPNGDGDLKDSINFVAFAELEYTYDTINKIAKIVGVPDGMTLGDYVISGLVLNPDDREIYTVTSIGTGAFAFNDTLTSIEIPEEVTNIDYMSFCHSTNLTSVNFLGEVTNIGYSAFSNCTGLTSISIPNGITKIETTTFLECTSLKNVILPEGLTSIAEDAFYKCTNLISINIPEGVTSIGENAFSNCSSLTSIEIPKGVTNIEMYTFGDCTSLKTVTLSEGLISIGNHAFSNCRSLETVNIPEGVTSIDYAAFIFCSNLKDVKISSKVTNIDESAFAGCDALTSIEIPEGVESIGDSAFSACNNLMSVTIYGEETSIGANAFNKYEATIYGYANSTAQTYADENSINFEPFMSGYKVEHYQESLDGEYVLAETEELEGASKTTIIAVEKTYEGFTYDNTVEGTIESGFVAEDNSLVLKLYYTRNEYTITFDTDGGSEVAAITQKYGTNITAPEDPTKPGYIFGIWYTDEGTYEFTTMPAENITLYSEWIIKAWMISYDLDGGNWGDIIMLDGSYTIETETFILEIPSKVGYTFIGWTGSNGEVPQTEVKIEKGTTGDLYFKANWKANTDTPYKEEYYKENLDGTYNEEADEEVTSTGTTGELTNVIAKTYEGFTAGTVTQEEILGDGSTVVKVYYTRNSYELVYKVDDEQYGEKETYKYEEPIEIRENPHKEGHMFTGWIGTVEKMPAKDVEITGNFMINSYTLKINYVYEDGRKAQEPYTETINYNTEYSVTSPEIAGYTADKEVVEGIIGTDNEEVTVTYIANTDTAYTVEYYYQGSNGEYPEEATDKDETRTGRTGEIASITEEDKEPKMLSMECTYVYDEEAENVISGVIAGDGSTVLKVYFKAQYTIRYRSAPVIGAIMQTISGIDYGEKTPEFTEEMIERPGYTFVGWNPEVEETVTKSVDYSAIWEANTDTPYTVKYYKETLKEGEYELAEEETRYGTTDEYVDVESKTYEGFRVKGSEQLEDVQIVKRGTIEGDGSTVFEFYYTRNSYNLVYKVDGVQYGETESYKYEEEITIKEEPSKEGHMFTGWIGTVEKMPAKNVEITGNFMINSYTLKINYVYSDGRKAQEPYEEELEYGSEYRVTSPEIAGYTADKEVVEGKVGTDNIEVTVTYLADTDTAYTVEHYKETLEEGEYELAEEETLYGTTGELTKAEENTYEGFTEVTVTQEEIQGDGRTVVKIYYTRNSYELVYKVDGVQHGEVESYKYEEEVTIKEEAEKEGYTFSGWTGTVEKMPAGNVEITGTFTINNYEYKVEYYYNNLIDNTKTEVKVAEYQSIVDTYEDKTEEGYKLGEAVNLPLTISEKEENNIIKVYYIADEAQTKELNYTVEYYKDGEKIENDTQIVKQKVQVLEPNTLIVDMSQINITNKYSGYRVEKTEPEQIPETINSGETIKIYYVEREVADIEIIAEPNKKEYTAFENFDATGMKIAIVYDNGDKIEIDSDKYIIEPNRALEVTDKNVVIKYKENEDITVEQEIVVNKAEGTQNPEYIKAIEDLQKDGTKEITYYDGLKLGDIELLEPWEWENPVTKLYVNGDGEAYKIVYISQNENYKDVENIVSIVVKVNKAEPKYELPTEIQAIEGDTLEALKEQLPEGYEFVDSLDTVIENIGYIEYKVRYIPKDTDNYNIAENIPIIIHVEERKVPVTDITMVSEFRIVEGGKAKLIANIVPEDATNKEVKWTSSNEDIVTVDKFGNIEAKQIGVAYIVVEAKDGGKTASCRVEVVEKVYDIEETKEETYVTEINPNTSKEVFEEKFVTIYEVEIYNLEGEKIEDDEIIGTGYTMNLYNEGELKEKDIKLIVKGDVTGEGQADCIDSTKIIYHRIGKEMLQGIYKKAADINKDGQVDGRDSTILIYHRLKMDGYKWEN